MYMLNLYKLLLITSIFLFQGELRFSGPVSFEAGDFITRVLQRNPAERLTLEECLRHPFIHKEYVKRTNADVDGEIEFSDL